MQNSKKNRVKNENKCGVKQQKKEKQTNINEKTEKKKPKHEKKKHMGKLQYFPHAF